MRKTKATQTNNVKTGLGLGLQDEMFKSTFDSFPTAEKQKAEELLPP